jgi:hypothetical protein
MTIAIDHDATPPDGIDALPAILAPPAVLEDQVMAGLQARGFIRRGRRRWVDAAAAAALVAVGVGLGTQWARPGDDVRPAYLLLLYPGPAAGPALDPRAEAAAAREYGAWAGRLRAEGRAITGERLAAGADTVPEAAPGGDGAVLQGFFVVSAQSAAEAAQIARTSPHVAWGGTVVVRAIDTPR